MDEMNVDEYGREQAKAWYCLVVYPGHAQKIRDKLLVLSKNESFQDQIFRIIIVTEKVIQTTKSGKQKTVERLIDGFQTYVFVEMILNDNTYHAVKMEKVRTFLGNDGPEIVPEDHMRSLFRMMNLPYDEERIQLGDQVRITNPSSAFYNQVGTVLECNEHKKETVISISMFGNEVKTKVPHNELKKIENE